MDMMSLRRRVMINQNKLVNATGNPITFNTPLTKPLKECVVRFTPKQEGSGTPSPDNVRNISGRSSVKLWQSGKNIYSGEQLLNLIHPNFTRYSDENGEYGNVGTGTSVDFPDGLFKENTQYTFILKTYSNASNVWGYSIIYADGTEKTITFPSGVAVQASVTKSGKTVKGIRSILRNPTRNVYYNESGVFEGACTVDDFEPYKGLNEITFTFPSTVGDNGVVYGGYVDAENGEVVEEWYSVPTSAWTTYKQNNGYICYRTGGSPGTISGGTWFSNVISEYGSFSSSAMNKNIIQKNGSSNGGTIYMALDENVDISTVQVVYPISTPIHHSLTPQSIATLRGNNTMWSDANEDITVRYWTR